MKRSFTTTVDVPSGQNRALYVCSGCGCVDRYRVAGGYATGDPITITRCAEHLDA